MLRTASVIISISVSNCLSHYFEINLISELSLDLKKEKKNVFSKQ